MEPLGLDRFFAIQLEVLIRRGFGERYHHIGVIIPVVLVLAALSYVFLAGIRINHYQWQILEPSPITGALFSLFTVAFLVTSIRHQAEIRRRLRAEVQLLSWYSGEPLHFWLSLHFSSEAKIKRFIEPACVALVGGFVFLYLSQVFGVYVLLCALAMMHKSHVEFYGWKNWILDTKDGTEVSRALRSATRDGDRTRDDSMRTAQVSTVHSSMSTGLQEALKRKNIMERLDPDLQAIMKGKSSPTPATAEENESLD